MFFVTSSLCCCRRFPNDGGDCYCSITKLHCTFENCPHTAQDFIERTREGLVVEKIEDSEEKT